VPGSRGRGPADVAVGAAAGTFALANHYAHNRRFDEEVVMGFGRGILLWLLGVPIPVILLLAMCSHH
jgi:hypothetical protein